MDLIAERDNDKIIFSAFVKRTLKKRADIISKDQDKNMPDFSDKSYSKRSFEVSEDSLIYKHKGLLRFMDMKRLTYPRSKIKYNRKKVYPVHNIIIMKQYDATMRELTYGLSDSIIAEIKAELLNNSSL
ncbi:MAG: hypothetical protein J6O88_05825 [Chryseobacterium sp.]|uniref:hypothetical protein n=1 Tax=Chryseobacterium sp. TaxID=1871047 RepID=UPI001B1C4DB9|nr:hypothetical protein [Chryseobacterium sp.]MBO6184201.1 hypothetical protein [Chryseobacterium sp.]